MLSSAKIEEIYKQNTQTFSSWVTTAKYILRVGTPEGKQALLVKNVQGDFPVWKMIAWKVFKKIIISHELLKTRKKIIQMAFGKYSLPLNKIELENLFRDPSNWWLDLTPEKVKLVKGFCDSFLSNEKFCEQICCEAGCSPDNYFETVESCRKAFNETYEWSFHISLQKSLFDYATQSIKRESADDSVKKYIASYNDPFFLEDKRRPDND